MLKGIQTITSASSGTIATILSNNGVKNPSNYDVIEKFVSDLLEKAKKLPNLNEMTFFEIVEACEVSA